MKTRVCAVLLLLAGVASSVQADVVSLTADRDNTLFEDATGSLSNGAGPVVFSGNNGQDLARRALFHFDVAGVLPHGARIDAVELRLNCSNASTATPRTMALHRVLRDWGEGTSSTNSGSGTAATPNDATWLHSFSPGSPWTQPGGDYAAPSASLGVGDVGPYVWSDDGLKADVQAWLNGTTPNDGWLLVGDETALNTARRFDSRENSLAASRPTLTVHYSFNTTGVDGTVESGPVRLDAAWPNPSREGVRIGYSLPSRARIELRVVDVAGRRVATLVDGWAEAGRGVASWDGRGLQGERLPAGLYLCRLTVNGRPVDTRTLVRVR
jgi:hypothetical protein